jgi:Ran GTPase-activating protein (RanGAP) involved in mRNA processing and transport
MELLGRLAANDPQLTKLANVPRSVGMRELATALALNTTLTSLWLWNRELDDASAHELAWALDRNRTLLALYLSVNNIGSDGAAAFRIALERNNTLRELRLSANDVGDDGARHLAAALERNKTLKTLDLSGNDIGSDGAAAFRTALERNNSLTELGLYDNRVGSDGARHLAAALELNTTLERLFLEDNDIGEVGAAALRAALETNCTLDELGGVEGVRDILERNRGVRVERKQQVMLQFFLLPGSFARTVLSCCCGSPRAEAIQPRALFAGIVSVVHLQQLSDTMECWSQSNVKDVVRLIARLLWGTKVGSWAGGVTRSPLTWFVVTGPFSVGQGRRPVSEVIAWTR